MKYRDECGIFCLHISTLLPSPFSRRKILNHHISKVVIVLCLFFLGSCASSTLNSAAKKGATVLTDEAIYSIVNNNTLRLVSSEFDSYLFFNSDGSLSGSSIFNRNLDYGSWDITSEGQLCIRYDVWYYGDVNCYGMYLDGNEDGYLLFTKNGSLAFTGTASTGNPQQLLIKTKKDKKTVYVRSSISQEQSTGSPRPTTTHAAPAAPVSSPAVSSVSPGTSHEEITHTVKSMAKDCPGCNFEDADLRRADLIGANLQDANLRGADLSQANLRRANLEGADLRGSTLLSTNLPGANLKDADLTGADLTGSNLIQADFTGADLDNVILDNTLQEGAKGLD